MDQRKTTGVGGGTSQEHEGDEAGTSESQLREQRKILELFGTIDYDPDYDCKAARKKKRL
jgi:hypothetical protein